MSIQTETQAKSITVILPKGKANPLMEALMNKNITRFSFAFARGFDIHDPVNRGHLPAYEEKEMVTVIAKDATEAEELFSFIYETANLNHLGAGFMYMTQLSAATAFRLPELSITSSSAPQATKSTKRPEASM